MLFDRLSRAANWEAEDKDPRQVVLGSELKMGRLAPLSSVALRGLLIVALAAFILALPMLVYGPMPQGADTYQHLNFARHFSEQFWAGELYPRWLIGMNHGLGTPTLFVYPPLPSYVCALLAPIAKLCHFDAFRVGEFLALFGSGLSALVWLCTMTSQGIARFGAVLYMMMPYHLALDYYRRTALSECWACVWMPLVLYFGVRAMKGGSVNLVGLAVAYAMLILSHLPTVFLFSPIPIGMVLWLSPNGRALASAVRVALGMILGIGLSSFYFISALSQAKYFPISRMPLWLNLDRHFLNLPTLLHQGGINHVVSLIVVSTVIPCILCSTVILAKASTETKKAIIFWLMPCIFSVGLMSSAASQVWRIFPLLHASVQYPGRLNIILCVASLPILAIFLSEISRWPQRSRRFWGNLLIVSVTPWLISYWAVWVHYQGQTPSKNLSVSDYDGWFLAWPAPGLDDASALRASGELPARFQAGTAGTASVLLWKPRHLEIQTNSPNGGEVIVNQFYYPPWRAALLDSYRAVDVEVAMPEGLIKVYVPPGPQHLRLEIPVGPAEYAGQWISGLSVVLSVLLAIGLDRRSCADLDPESMPTCVAA